MFSRSARVTLILVSMLVLSACATAPSNNNAVWDDALLEKRFTQAEAAYQQGRYTIAAGLLLPLAEHSHPQALYTLGHMNFYGHGMKQDRRRAVVLFRRAAELGSAKALDAIPLGHKIALGDIADGDAVLKYGHDIGKAVAAIPAGSHVHVQNLKTKKW